MSVSLTLNSPGQYSFAGWTMLEIGPRNGFWMLLMTLVIVAGLPPSGISRPGTPSAPALNPDG